jgi:hypothetical protein
MGPSYTRFEDRAGIHAYADNESAEMVMLLFNHLKQDFEEADNGTGVDTVTACEDFFKKVLGSLRFTKNDLNIQKEVARTEASFADNLIEKSATMVELIGPDNPIEVTTAWCDENFPGRWQIVGTRRGCAYLFEEKKSAALFKLMFG